MITVIFTCFNRKEKTLQCMRSISEGNRDLSFSYIIVDDGSTDGTYEALKKLQNDGTRIKILRGDGNLFWAGGMRMGIRYAKEHTDSEYYLLVNDDVDFAAGSLQKMTMALEAGNYGPDTVLVGAVCDEKGVFSYGGIRYGKGIHYENVAPYSRDLRCDTFNMNCLLIPQKVFMETPNFDRHYIHSLADFDYGLDMTRRGVPVFVFSEYVGVCPDNDKKGGWRDSNLPRLERLKKKESAKGAPWRPWFYFLKKNFGLGTALLHGFTPFLRILAGK